MNDLHYPVMNREVVAILKDSPRPVFIDCTVGMGGHSARILSSIPGSRVLAIDEDADSLERARARLAAFSSRVRFCCGNFLRLFDWPESEWRDAGGVLVDPGLSTVQLKEGKRGFSHSLDGPLDMRKDRRQPLTAEEVVNRYSEAELASIFSRYGEVDKHREVAKRIIERRLFSPIATTVQLRTLVEEVYRWRGRRGLLHPAAKVFQALRIHINRELEGLEGWIRSLPGRLRSGTRLVVLSYHSLEDRIVKRTFRALAGEGALEILRPDPRLPGADEVAENPASRSARLRSAILS